MAGRKPRAESELDDAKVWGDEPGPVAPAVSEPLADDFETQVEARVQERLDAFKSEIVATLAEQLRTARGDDTAEPELHSGDRALISSLAVELARLTDPHNVKQTISPEVAKARAAAKERMMALLMQAHVEKKMPTYILRNKAYLGEILIEPKYEDPVTHKMEDQGINWPGIPNLAMVPTNEIAERIFTEYKDFIGSVGKAPTGARSPWALSGGKIKRTDFIAPSAQRQVGDGMAFDPRRPLSEDSAPETVAVLGTVFAPVKIDPRTRP